MKKQKSKTRGVIYTGGLRYNRTALRFFLVQRRLFFCGAVFTGFIPILFKKAKCLFIKHRRPVFISTIIALRRRRIYGKMKQERHHGTGRNNLIEKERVK